MSAYFPQSSRPGGRGGSSTAAIMNRLAGRNGFAHPGMFPPAMRVPSPSGATESEVVVTIQGGDGSTYTVTRHSPKSKDSTSSIETKKDADDDGGSPATTPASSSVSRPDEDDVAEAMPKDLAAALEEVAEPAKSIKSKQPEKSLLANGIDAALKSDRIQRHEEVWNDFEQNWIPRIPKLEDPAKGRILFIYRLRWQTEDTPEPFVTVELYDKGIVEILRANLVGYEDLLDDKAKILGRDLFLLASDLKTVVRETRQQADDLDAGKIKAEDIAKPPEASIDADHTSDGKIVLPTPTSLRHQADVLEILLECNAREFASTYTKLQRIPEGQISFKLLWTLFKPRIDIAFDHSLAQRKMAAQLTWSNYVMTDAGEEFRLDGLSREWVGQSYAPKQESVSIKAFRGFKPITELHAYPLPADLKAQLTERGKLYHSYTGAHHAHYHGNVSRVVHGPMGSSVVKVRANGRCVIDTAAYRRFNPSSAEFANVSLSHPVTSHRNTRGRRMPIMTPPPPAAYDIYGDPIPVATRKETVNITSLPDDELHLTPPVQYGLALVSKTWGAMILEDLSPIKWREHAFDHLQINEDDKSTIRALVTASVAKEEPVDRLTDVIEGKGGGITILLHGRPGTGKTLTAESTAELLKRPLYPLTAGDLSDSSGQLEENLRDVFETSATWQAVILLDEADVFLEARSRHEIHRNSLISVFLRMLEYHQGTMFLTTNRVRVFDPAVFSRFSIALRFPDLEVDRRRIVFEKFLQQCGVKVSEEEGASVTPADIDRFSKEDLNGRVIKRVLQTAQALAQVDKKPLATTYIDKCLRIHRRFIKDFEAIDEEGNHFEDAQVGRVLYA